MNSVHCILYCFVGALHFATTSNFRGYTSTVSFEHFEEIKMSRYFLDRTLFIKEFLEEPRRLLITAPRRSGKSLNMDALWQFAGVDVNADGSMKSDPRTHKNYALFSEPVPNTNKLLGVFQDRRFFDKHFGKYLTICMDLNYVHTCSVENTENTLKTQIVRRAFAAHEYLLQSSVLNKKEKEVIENFLFKASQQNPHSASDGIGFLQDYLFKHFNGTKCIMLVDEIDSPLKSMILTTAFTNNEILQLVDHLKQFLVTALRGNTLPIHGILLIGCSRLARILLNDVKNVEHISFSADNSVAKFYGVTQDQVNFLAQQENLSKEENRTIALWYDGYRTEDTHKRFYNVFSIVNYFCKRKFKPYWVDTGSLKIFRSMFLPEILGEKLIVCAQGGNITINYEIRNEMKHIEELSNIYPQNRNKAFKQNEAAVNLFLQFMYDEGYFTPIEKGTNGHICAAPNYEVRDYLKDLSLEGLRLRNPDAGTSEFIKWYFKTISNIDGTESSFREFLKVMVVLLDDTNTEPENEISFGHSISAMMYFPQYFSRDLNQIDIRYVQHNVLVMHKKEFTDLLFVVMIKRQLIGFVIQLKFSRKAVKTPFEKSYGATNQTLDREYSKAFNSEKVKDAVGGDVDIKVLMEFHCDAVHCSLNYLYNTKNLTDTSSIKVKRTDVIEEWNKYKHHFEHILG